MKIVYLDEAGNTGSDLFSIDQPVFISSSCDLSLDESKTIIETYFGPKSFHFKKVRQSKGGRSDILRFWKENLEFVKARTKTISFHKQFISVCQLFNYFYEPIAEDMGIDYYDRGFNIAHANMHFFNLPVVLGKTGTKKLFDLLVTMFDLKTKESIDDFYQFLSPLPKTIEDPKYAGEFEILLESRKYIDIILDGSDKYIFDPNIHCAVDQVRLWNAECDNFSIVHDRSNTVFHKVDLIEFLKGIESPPIEIGYGDAKTRFPLGLKKFDFDSSETNTSLQFCDLIGSSVFFCHQADSVNVDLNLFRGQLKGAIGDLKYANTVWPSTDVNPIESRAKGPNDIDALDFFSFHLAERDKRK